MCKSVSPSRIYPVCRLAIRRYRSRVEQHGVEACFMTVSSVDMQPLNTILLCRNADADPNCQIYIVFLIIIVLKH